MRHQCPECGIFFAGPPHQKMCRTCNANPRYAVIDFDPTIIIQAMEQYAAQRISAEAAEDLRLWLLQDVT